MVRCSLFIVHCSLFIAPFLEAVASSQTVDAGAIIEKTSRIYEEWGGLEAQFVIQSYSMRNGSSESYEGVIRTNMNKFVLTTPDMLVWFDGVTQWIYLPRADEVNISTPSADELRILNPMMLLQDYQKDYQATLTGESTSANAKVAYDITLTPKKTDTIEKIEIQIEKNTSLPVKLVITMRNYLRNTIIINELKKGNFPDELFSFPKASYPDAEIIDLR